MGTTETVLAPAGEALFDWAHAVEVRLLHGGMELQDADADRIFAGANLAVLGNELIQFGRAEPLGDGRWRLSGLVRGRHGTEWAAGFHAAGERFVLIEPDALVSYDPPLSAAGAEVRILASGIGDPSPVAATASAVGEALRPPPPVHVRAERLESGGFTLRWTRQSRIGWNWLDSCDAPLGEDGERYRLTIVRGDGLERVYEPGASTFDYAAADAAADAAFGPTVTIILVQIGTSAASRPALMTLEL
jgi:hypothetical protein